MVPEIDYLNARIRGMMGRLISRRQREAALAADSVPEWVESLKGSIYSAQLGPPGREQDPVRLYGAVDRATASMTNRLAGMSTGKVGMGLEVLLGEWDLGNLLAVVSGVRLGAEPIAILGGTLGGGILGPDQIETLSRSRTTKEVADRLTTWMYPYAQAVRRALGKTAEKPLLDVRLDLSRSFFSVMRELAKACGSPVIIRYLGTRIDIMNLLTANQWGSLPADRDPAEFFLDGGREFDIKHFRTFLRASDFAEAAYSVEGPVLRRLIQKAMAAYEKTSRSSVIRQAFEKEMCVYHNRPLNIDPLDMSLALGFVLRLRRDGVLLKLAITRLLLNAPREAFNHMVEHV